MSFDVLFQGHKQDIFFWGGKVIFPDFFPGVKCFFPVENFHFGRPKTNFSGFEKWKEKKKSSPHFVTFPPSISILHLPSYNFPSFPLHFPLFPCLFFSDRPAEISRSEVLFGGAVPPAPPTCNATVLFDGAGDGRVVDGQGGWGVLGDFLLVFWCSVWDVRSTFIIFFLCMLQTKCYCYSCLYLFLF